MKLDTGNMETLTTALTVASMLNIKEMVVGKKEGVRGADEDRTVVLYQKEGDDFGFDSMGINNTNALLNRTKLYPEEVECIGEVDESDEDFVTSITLKAKGFSSKVTTRIANPSTIPAPSKLKYTEQLQFALTGVTVDMIHKAVKAMEHKFINIAYDGEDIIFKIVTEVNDDWSYVYEGEVEEFETDSEIEAFDNSYSASKILTLFNYMKDGGEVIIGANGMLRMEVDGFTVYVIPQT